MNLRLPFLVFRSPSGLGQPPAGKWVKDSESKTVVQVIYSGNRSGHQRNESQEIP